jgi:hypothetical protein
MWFILFINRIVLELFASNLAFIRSMLTENLVSFFFGILMTFIVQRLFGGNKDFFKIIEKFRKKLPPKDKKAKIVSKGFIGMQHMNLKTLEYYITNNDLDYFLKELEDFDYKNVYLRRNQIKSYSQNIQRIIKTKSFEKFKIGMLQEILDGEKHDKFKPYLLGSKVAKVINF